MREEVLLVKINDLVASRKIKLKIGILKRDNLNKFSTTVGQRTKLSTQRMIRAHIFIFGSRRHKHYIIKLERTRSYAMPYYYDL